MPHSACTAPANSPLLLAAHLSANWYPDPPLIIGSFCQRLIVRLLVWLPLLLCFMSLYPVVGLLPQAYKVSVRCL